jgi:predicted Na+-dependent transporter
VLAAPILALVVPGAAFSPASVIENLALVVALPLAAGMALRAWASVASDAGSGGASRPRSRPAPRAGGDAAPRAGSGGASRTVRTVAFLATPRAGRTANLVVVAAVAGLVALVASEIHFSADYASVTVALLLFLAACALLGRLLAARSTRPVAAALLLTTSMRDFAIAAAIATAAFGPSAAAPLGIYGVAVLIWGTACAGFVRNAAGAQDRLANSRVFTGAITPVKTRATPE